LRGDKVFLVLEGVPKPMRLPLLLRCTINAQRCFQFATVQFLLRWQEKNKGDEKIK